MSDVVETRSSLVPSKMFVGLTALPEGDKKELQQSITTAPVLLLQVLPEVQTQEVSEGDSFWYYVLRQKPFS